MPFTADKFFDEVPVISDEELKEQGFYSEVPLSEIYRKNYDTIKQAEPALHEHAANTELS